MRRVAGNSWVHTDSVTCQGSTGGYAFLIKCLMREEFPVMLIIVDTYAERRLVVDSAYLMGSHIFWRRRLALAVACFGACVQCVQLIGGEKCGYGWCNTSSLYIRSR